MAFELEGALGREERHDPRDELRVGRVRRRWSLRVGSRRGSLRAGRPRAALFGAASSRRRSLRARRQNGRVRLSAPRAPSGRGGDGEEAARGRRAARFRRPSVSKRSTCARSRTGIFRCAISTKRISSRRSRRSSSSSNGASSTRENSSAPRRCTLAARKARRRASLASPRTRPSPSGSAFGSRTARWARCSRLASLRRSGEPSAPVLLEMRFAHPHIDFRRASSRFARARRRSS